MSNNMYNDSDRIFFNQNVIYYKDKTYNSGGSLEITISNNTVDYKSFSSPTIHISIVGENNLRRLSTLNYTDSVDLYNSIKYIVQNIETIYSTNRNNVLIKKYQYDRTLKFEFIQIPDINERVVTITIMYNQSDFAKVVVPYTVFTSFAVGVLKYFVNEYVNISFMMSTRNLLTEVLEQTKLIKNGILLIPPSIVEIKSGIDRGDYHQIARADSEETNLTYENETTEILNDFDKFLGKDMQNINLDDLNSKIILEEKVDNSEINSLFINNTLSNDLSILESMLTSCVTRPDPMISLFEGFRRSMNLDEEFTFLPDITLKDLKSFLYISKIMHDHYLNLHILENKSIPSGFHVLKYNIEDKNKINDLNIQILYDLLLISGFVKIYRNKIESKDSDININGSLFYLKIRTFLDPLIYSFLDDETKHKIITTTLCKNFEKYSNIGFFKKYQKTLKEYNCDEITIDDIRNFCNELVERVLTKGVLTINIGDRHDNLFKSGFLRINSDNNLTIEQILNELLPLEVLEKTGVNLKENSNELNEIIKTYNISNDILNIFLKKEIKPEKISNILKTVNFYNSEIPEKNREQFFDYINKLKNENFDFNNGMFEMDEFGDNIIKALYVWNESDNKKEHLTDYRAKLEDCLLTKDLILAKYNNLVSNNNDDTQKPEENWDLNILD